MRCTESASHISTCRLRRTASGRQSSALEKPSKETESFAFERVARDRHVVVTAISTKTVGNYVSIRRTPGQQIFTLRGKTVQIKNWAYFFFAATRTCAKESASVQCRRQKTSLCNDSFVSLDNFRAAGRRSFRR